jgi:hypothetical protein
VACTLLACILPGYAAANGKESAEPPLLPQTFSGWRLSSSASNSNDPAVADAVNAAVLQECGFVRFAGASYTRDDGTLQLRAMQFGDASGAMSAFTFYRRPNMLAETIGSGAAYDGKHILFWIGDMVVDATFSRITAMSASELRGLAQTLPAPAGSTGIAPGIGGYLPAPDLEPATERYALGPQTYTLGGGTLPATLVDFARGAETMTAQYKSVNGEGTLTLINYPTPQIAMDRTRALQAYLQTGNTAQNPWTPAIENSNSGALLVRRSGPIVAVTSGAFSTQEAQNLIGLVHYEANVVSDNPDGIFSDASKMGQLIVGIFVLVGILAGTALILGIFFGGGRAMVRILRGKSASALDESAEIIRLNLKE